MVKRYSLVFLGILVIVLIGIVGFNHLIPNDKVFENQFIKFNYSSNLNVVDYSNNTSLLVVIYDGDVDPSNYEINAVGNIRITNDNLKNLNVNTTNKIEFKNVTISGYKGIVVYDTLLDNGAIISLNDSAALAVLLDKGYDPYIDTIVNTFVIKEVPPQLTILK